ncbi:DUF4198 domain-containing protein [Acinetobacter rathckeae]|uniref:DUF4198 domain-containing protein n=1 Tax=Acinetobacter rathckeae TaxID=2605272 RepID=UPI0018A2A2B8|nr:DUF4198 domain-containing protein [Acinetobacter rathckeae]MBF7688689.1 DUF4198 domain-containing protein [Acinetobacter rathckeae]MBF7696082.1 DUF4198 domain-containing protein [Acinetobacter rathckeae]
MKKLLLVAALTASATVSAHQPYVSTLVGQTENSRTPIIAGYAEEALSSEAALKKAVFSVVDPESQVSQVTPETQLKSATVFDLSLPKEGTYKVNSTISYNLKYAFQDKAWQMFLDMPTDKAPAKASRHYLIPSDFKKTPETVDVTREWTIQSYISKKHTSAIKDVELAPIDLTFSIHPNEIKANQDVVVYAHNHSKNEHLGEIEVSVRKLGESDEQAKLFSANKEGETTIRFATAGQYLVVATPKFNPQVKPTTQYFTIVSLHVNH